MTAKSTPWDKIKAEYMSGEQPKELSEKYNLTTKQINEKASKSGWVEEKKLLSSIVNQKTKEAISDNVLKTLEDLGKDSDEMIEFLKNEITAPPLVVEGKIIQKDSTGSLVRALWLTWDKKLRSMCLPDKITRQEIEASVDMSVTFGIEEAEL